MNQLIHFKANISRLLFMDILEDKTQWTKDNKVIPIPRLWKLQLAFLLS